jgi:Zn-dependent protease with chaperone function
MNEDRASRYQRLRRRGAVASGSISVVLLAGLILSGGSARLRDVAVSWSDGNPGSAATAAIFVCLLALVHEALTFPAAVYRGFLVERQYGLSRESFGEWAADHAKAAALGLVLAIAASAIVYAALRHAPGWWWLAAGVTFAAAIGVLANLTPIVVMPMFYRFAPLAREALKTRLEALSSRAGVGVLGVYEWGLGEKTRRANAALVGTGRTRRIILSDTLLADYTDDEIEVVLAHELGHQVHRDIVIALAIESALLVAACYGAAVALDAGWRPAGLTSPADVAGLPLLLLAGGAVTVLATPFVNAVSRSAERRADRFALALTGRSDAFITAMRRLADQNLAEPRPSAFARWFFHTHPPVEERIEAARLVERPR